MCIKSSMSSLAPWKFWLKMKLHIMKADYMFPVSGELTLFICLFRHLGHTSCSRVFPGSVLRNHSWQCSRDHMKYWASKPTHCVQGKHPTLYIISQIHFYYYYNEMTKNKIIFEVLQQLVWRILSFFCPFFNWMAFLSHYKRSLS